MKGCITSCSQRVRVHQIAAGLTHWGDLASGMETFGEKSSSPPSVLKREVSQDSDRSWVAGATGRGWRGRQRTSYLDTASATGERGPREDSSPYHSHEHLYNSRTRGHLKNAWEDESLIESTSKGGGKADGDLALTEEALFSLQYDNRQLEDRLADMASKYGLKHPQHSRHH